MYKCMIIQAGMCDCTFDISIMCCCPCTRLEKKKPAFPGEEVLDLLVREKNYSKPLQSSSDIVRDNQNWNWRSLASGHQVCRPLKQSRRWKYPFYFAVAWPQFSNIIPLILIRVAFFVMRWDSFTFRSFAKTSAPMFCITMYLHAVVIEQSQACTGIYWKASLLFQTVLLHQLTEKVPYFPHSDS